MKHFSDGTYGKPEEENIFIATVVEDLALNPGGDFDGFYTMFPNYKAIEYMWPRRLSGSQITEFVNWCGAQNPIRTGYESAFMHDVGFTDSAHRKVAPWGGTPMMLDHTDYLDYLADKAVRLVNRTWWGAKPSWQNYAGYVLIDLCQFYYEFDSGQEDVANTNEYTGVTLDDEHPRAYNCVSSSSFIQSALDAEFGTGAARVHMMPNYGNLLFSARGDQRTSDFLDLVNNGWAMMQVAFEMNTADTNFDNNYLDQRFSWMDTLMDTRNIRTLCSFYDNTASSPDPTDHGKRLAAGIFYLMEHNNLYVSYKSAANGTGPGRHSDVYEWNPMMKSGYLGVPRSPRTVDGGGRLYERIFENGKVYVWTKETKTDASTERVITIPVNAYKMNEDGSLSALGAGPYSLWSNDALILIERNNITVTNQPTASPVEEFAASGSPHYAELDETVPSANDNDFINTLQKNVADHLAFPIPGDCKRISRFTFGFRFTSLAGGIVPAGWLLLQNDNGEVFASNEINAVEATLVNKQHTFCGLDLAPDQFQNNRVVVRFVTRDDADNTNAKTLATYAI